VGSLCDWLAAIFFLVHVDVATRSLEEKVNLKRSFEN
jgi:hypothetical protein